MMSAVDDQAGTGNGGGHGWAVPGSAVEQPVRDAPEVLPAGAGWPSATPTDRVAAVPAAPEIPHIPLHPRTLADILDGGFAVFKARPKRILAVTAAFVVPAQLIAAFVQRNVGGGGFDVASAFSNDPTVLEEQSSSGDWQLVALILVLIVASIALVCVATAISHLVTQWTMGRDPAAGELFGVVGRRAWPLLASFVLVKLAEAVGAAVCYIGIPFVMTLFLVVAPVIAVENEGPLAAMGRSVRLVRPRYFPAMGIALVMALVSELLGLALSALPQALAAWIGLERGWPLLAVGGIASELIVLPFVAASTVLLYLDLRVRTEGFDIEMSAVQVLDRAAI
jgi:hypothetical protein